MAEPTNANLSEIFNENNYYVIPKYQRGYKWEIKQCVELWEDLCKVIDGTIESHYLGTIILDEPVGSTGETGMRRYDVVDGQQRLTTLSLLFLALEDSLADLLKNNNDEEINEIKERIDRMLRIQSKQARDYFNRTPLLSLQRVDDDVYNRLIAGNKNQKEDSSSRLYVAYEEFKNILKREISSHADIDAQRSFLRKMRNALLNDIRLIKIVTDKENEVHSIFESLNNRGIELEQIDLIKNYFMMQTSDDSSFYEKYWGHFDTNVWWSKNSLVRPTDTRLSNCFFWFLRQQPYHSIERKSIRSLLKNYDNLYKDFISHIDLISRDKGISRGLALALLFEEFNSIKDEYMLLHDMSSFKKEPYKITKKHPSIEEIKKERIEEFIDRAGPNSGYSWLVAIWCLKNRNKLSTADFVDILNIFETFIIRKRIANPSNIAGAIGDMIDKMNLVPINEAKKALIDKISSSISRKDFGIPQDEQVISALINYPINEPVTKLAKTILYAMEENSIERTGKILSGRLERSSTDKKGKTIIPIEVEHIIPQVWDTYWPLDKDSSSEDIDSRNNSINLIGNLLLLTSATNNEVGNYAFNVKVKKYKNDTQKIIMVKDFLNKKYKEWTKEQIDLRSREIANFVNKTWSLDFLPDDPKILASFKQVETIGNIAQKMEDRTELFFLTRDKIWKSGRFGINSYGNSVIIFDSTGVSFTSLKELFMENDLIGKGDNKNYWEKIFIERDESIESTVKEYLASQKEYEIENRLF